MSGKRTGPALDSKSAASPARMPSPEVGSCGPFGGTKPLLATRRLGSQIPGRSNFNHRSSLRRRIELALLLFCRPLPEYGLESADKLGAPDWKPVTGAVNNRLTVSPGGNMKYYRLRKL